MKGGRGAEVTAMIYGCVLLAVAALVVVAAVVCWLAGVQLVALVKIALTVCAVLLTVAGVIVVSGDLLLSAGYFNSSRVEPTKPILVTDFVVTEQQQLGWMHEHTVGVFIEGQGFGKGRMMSNFTDIISAPRTRSGNNDDEQGPFAPYVRVAGKGKVHNGVQSTDTNGSLWNGNLRTNDGSEMWTVRTVYLLGLVKQPRAVVYLTDQVPKMKDGEGIPTRELDTFEKTALEKLKGGENLVVEKNDKTIRVLGPIYAGKSCVKCHEQKGQLLGAFTYQLERVPVANQGKNSEVPPP